MTEDEYEDACITLDKLDSFKQKYQDFSDDLCEVQEALDSDIEGPYLLNEDKFSELMDNIDNRIDELKDQIHDYEEENNE